MKIAHTYSHLNGEEFLIVHFPKLYEEIREVITSIDADNYRIKISKEKKTKGVLLLSPKELNKAFEKEFQERKWAESRYNYYITLNRELMEQSLSLPAKQQRQFLADHGEQPIYSYNQTDFVKDKIAVEV